MNFAEIFAIALSGVMLAIAFDDFMDEGMIFHWWRRILNANPDVLIFKVMGGCLTCTTVWAVVLMYVLFQFAYPVWEVLTMVSLGNILLTIYIVNNY